MKVLWVTPIILPEMAKELNINNKGSGGWLGAMLPMLLERNEITEVHILCLGKEKKNKTFTSGKAIYHYQY
ncbi:hypothetical protein, partial [Vibrio parahaemolyticus]|uniref:hypothetical protein n=1 Tax=Vibrio parahaemolyticus TaxID=670 RepID=UPI0011246A2F